MENKFEWNQTNGRRVGPVTSQKKTVESSNSKMYRSKSEHGEQSGPIYR